MRIARLVVAASLTALAASSLSAQDADRSVKDGGVKVAGWKARIDRRAMTQGKTVNDSKFAAEAGGYRVSVGPAGNFWNPANVAKGNYEVKATFKELKMAATHPHSYGIFIGGRDLETEHETLMYCIAYGNGTYAIKTFHGADVKTLVAPTAHDALKKADANGESTNTVGWRVKGGKASCMINGAEVKSFRKTEVVGANKLTSLNGIYGIRVSHNLELQIGPIAVSKWGLSHRGWKWA
ncbi:MAG: hypothetical protein ABIW79_07335 [Gemmatimonas sp.]